jgi:mono/diheme cytochrome c family protein
MIAGIERASSIPRRRARPAIGPVAVGTLAALACASVAAQPSKLGQREYRNSCAVCHGTGGKGDGSYGYILEKRMPDLTLLSKNNGGVFPLERVYETIDGSATVKAHGTKEMPIRGDRYRMQAAEYYVDVPYDDRAFVRTRILALIEYLSTLQVK